MRALSKKEGDPLSEAVRNRWPTSTLSTSVTAGLTDRDHDPADGPGNDGRPRRRTAAAAAEPECRRPETEDTVDLVPISPFNSDDTVTLEAPTWVKRVTGRMIQRYSGAFQVSAPDDIRLDQSDRHT